MKTKSTFLFSRLLALCLICCLLISNAVYVQAADTPITAFALINAKTDQVIAGYENLQDGAVINLSHTGLNGDDRFSQLNVNALTGNTTVGSVYLTLSGPVAKNAMQNEAPYPIFGDDQGNFRPGSLPIGKYTLSATPYSLKNRKGTKGATATIHFEVVDQPFSLVQQQKLFASDGIEHMGFGEIISVSGKYAVIGAPIKGFGYTDKGSAYVFEKTTSGWKEIKKLESFPFPGYTKDGDEFGRAVSINGNNMMIGARSEGDYEDAILTGGVYVYELAPTGWQQTQHLKVKGTINHFGSSVAISGNYALIGEGGLGHRAFFYEKKKSGWQKVKFFEHYSEDFYSSNFGGTVAIDSIYAVVSNDSELAVSHDDGADDRAGTIYTYQRTATGWKEVQKIYAANKKLNTYFGQALSLQGQQLAVGAPGIPLKWSGKTKGSVSIFERKAATWSEVTQIFPSDTKIGDEFGKSVSLSGNKLVVGSASGIYVFEKTAQGWKEIYKINKQGTDFGSAVAIAGDQVLAGALSDNGKTTNTGAVYVYKEQNTSTTVPDNGIANFTLINADTDQPLGNLTNGQQLTLSQYPTVNFNISAEAQHPATVKSVAIEVYLNGNLLRRNVQNDAPFSLFGDNQGDYKNWQPATGTYRIKATPYSVVNKGGQTGQSLEITFTVTANQSGSRLVSYNEKGKSQLDEITTKDERAFAIYPNPTEGVLQAMYTGTAADPLILTIYNVLGQVVMQKSATGTLQMEIDLGSQPAGMYTAVLLHGSQKDIRKIIKN